MRVGVDLLKQDTSELNDKYFLCTEMARGNSYYTLYSSRLQDYEQYHIYDVTSELVLYLKGRFYMTDF